MRSLITRQRDFLFKYRILRKFRHRRRSRPVRIVVPHWRTPPRCRGTIGPPFSRAHEKYHRSFLPRKSSAGTTRFAWPGLTPTSGITLKLAIATTRNPQHRASSAHPLLIFLVFADSHDKPAGWRPSKRNR